MNVFELQLDYDELVAVQGILNEYIERDDETIRLAREDHPNGSLPLPVDQFAILATPVNTRIKALIKYADSVKVANEALTEYHKMCGVADK